MNLAGCVGQMGAPEHTAIVLGSATYATYRQWRAQCGADGRVGVVRGHFAAPGFQEVPFHETPSRASCV
jgi:hypothetical protein